MEYYEGKGGVGLGQEVTISLCSHSLGENSSQRGKNRWLLSITRSVNGLIGWRVQ